MSELASGVSGSAGAFLFGRRGKKEKKNQHNEPKLPLCLTLYVSLSASLLSSPSTLCLFLPSSSRQLLLCSQISCSLAAFGKGQISISNVCCCFFFAYTYRAKRGNLRFRLEVKDTRAALCAHKQVFKYPTFEPASGDISTG